MVRFAILLSILGHSPTADAAAEPSLVMFDGRATETRFTATAGLAAVAPVDPAAVGLFLMSDVRNDERSRLERRNRVRLKKFSTMRGLNIVSGDVSWTNLRIPNRR